MNKRLTNSILCGLAILIASSVFFFSFTSTSTVSASSNITKPTIVIDAGHGGEDGGAATSDNILEKDINLEISLKLREYLLSNGFDVIMTRETDTAIYDSAEVSNKKLSDLENRVEIFNSSENNIVISIHQNKFTQSQYNGTQVFYSANNSNSEKLAECIKSSVVNLIQPDNKRQCKKAGSEIFILNNSKVPAVLVECGFLSNDEEALKLQDDTYQTQLAYCIYLGFMEYYYNTNY